ncbi:uncharacterized protein LOC117120696 [Anneissia japonica]|uniref:uncharacterized protein LOC117120696 n=1 Tax=Anneissia japonica TaxID=1529436 RepID=UPI0014258439|nr:uncharacterized protein LOC117120696 [Anneissia japonica]
MEDCESISAPLVSLSSSSKNDTVPCQRPPSSARKRKQMVPKPIREATENDEDDGNDEGGDTQASSSEWNLPPKKPVGKMLPLHCIVEQRQYEQLPQQKEDYAIVSSELVLKELLNCVLCKLGFRYLDKYYIEGHLQVRNWKALPFSAICENEDTTVGHLFGEIISHVSLIIKLKKRMESTSWLPNQMLNTMSPLRQDGHQEGNRGTGSTLHDIATKIRQLIDKRGPSMLVCHGCPFSQNIINQILTGKCSKLISSEKVTAFYLWYNIYSRLADNTLVSAGKLDSSSATKFMPRRVRGQRTLFDPRYEIPLLFKWYRQNPRPSRLELEAYLSQLNSSEKRRNGHPLQYSSLAIWFKNARAKYRDFNKIPSIYRFERNDEPSLPLNYSQKNYSHRRMIELQDMASQSEGNSRQDPTAQALETLSNVATKVASSLAMSTVCSRVNSRSSESLACSQLSERYNTVLQRHRQINDVSESQPNRTKTTLTVPQPLVPILVGSRHQPWQTIVSQNASNGSTVNAQPTSSIIRSTTHQAPVRPPVLLKGKVSVPSPRKRFNIHPTLEAPRLESWFTVTPKPDREIIRVYAQQLNSTEFRRSRDKYTSRIIYVWFKNRRAKQNRLQQRHTNKEGIGLHSVSNSEECMDQEACEGSDMESNLSGNLSNDQSINYSHGDHVKLESWFQDNPDPSPEALEEYTNELNSEGPSSRGGQKMDVEAVSQWFTSRREAAVSVIKEEPDMYMQASDDDNSDDWSDVTVRHTVLELLKDLNQTRLAQISPLSQSMISCIANARYTAAISKDKCQEFGRWYRIYRAQAQTQGFDQ